MSVPAVQSGVGALSPGPGRVVMRFETALASAPDPSCESFDEPARALRFGHLFGVPLHSQEQQIRSLEGFDAPVTADGGTVYGRRQAIHSLVVATIHRCDVNTQDVSQVGAVQDLHFVNRRCRVRAPPGMVHVLV